jgi:hypothetical protein
MIREVVLDQLGRPRLAEQTPLKRAAAFLGSPDLHRHLTQPLAAILSQNKIGLVLVLVTVACTVAAFRVRGARIHPTLLIAGAAVLLASPSYFTHYGALTAPFLATTVGICVAGLLRGVPSKRVAAAIGVAVLVAVLALNVPVDVTKRTSVWVPTTVLRPAAQKVKGCVMTDDPQILAALDVLSRDLDRGCPLWPDVTGYTYDRDSVEVAGKEVPRRDNPVWQRDVAAYLLSGQAVIVHRAATRLDPATNRLVRSGRVLARSGSWTLHAVDR